jgi:putative oxidoreductase
MKIAVLIARVLLGLVYLVFGLNFFFHFSFIPSAHTPAGPAGAFEMGLIGTGYFFQYMKVVEIICGLFLIINRYTAFFNLVIFPISLNIFLFHLILVPAGAPMGIIIILLNLFLGFAYRKYYSSMFTAVPTVS